MQLYQHYIILFAYEHNVNGNLIHQAVQRYVSVLNIKWASMRQNLSSGFLKRHGSNQSPQLHRPARNLKFQL